MHITRLSDCQCVEPIVAKLTAPAANLADFDVVQFIATAAAALQVSVEQLSVRSVVPGSVVVELAVMPPVWLTVFPALERARLVAVLQEGAAPLFGELAYDVAVVYPVQQPPASSGKKGLEVNTVIVAMVASLGALFVLIVGLMHAKRRGWIFPTEVAQDPSVVAGDFSRMLEAPPPLPGSSAYIAMLAEKAKQTKEERGAGAALQGDTELYEAVRPSRTRSVEVPQLPTDPRTRVLGLTESNYNVLAGQTATQQADLEYV